MKKIFSLMVLFLFWPSFVFAGYVLHQEINTDGQKSEIVYMTEGANKRMDVYVDGQLSISMISDAKRQTPLYLMHDSDSYMTKMPSTSSIPMSFPEIKYEPPKQPVNPAQKVVDAMDTTEKVEQKVRDFKSRPWEASQDVMQDVASEMQEYQQQQMMKQQMAKVQEMQKQMMSQMQGQLEMMNRRIEKEKRTKNTIAISDFKVTPTAKTQKIGKYNTKLVQVFYKGDHFEDCWVTGDIGADVRAAFNAFTADVKIVEPELAQYYKTIKLLNDKIYANGFPVLTSANYKGKTKVLYSAVADESDHKVEIKMTKLEQKKIDGNEFAIPKGYEEYKM